MRRFGVVVHALAIGGVVFVLSAASGGNAGAQEGVNPSREITLDEALRLALSGNRELETARLQLAQAEGQAREAWSAVYPTLDASASYTRNLEVPGQFLPAQIFDPDAPEGELLLVRFGTDNNWFGQLRFEQPLFQAGAFIGVGAAGRFQGLQEEIVRGRTHEIVTRTKQRYFDALLAEEAERLNQESVRRVRQALEETQAMHRAGMVGEYDVLRLEVELANLESALRRAANAAQAARRELAVELALDGVEDIQVSGSLATVELGTVGTSDPLATTFGVDIDSGLEIGRLLETARRNRSEVRQAELTQQLRGIELRAEQAEYLPRVSFFATYGISAQADGGINPFGWGSGRSISSPQAGLQVTMPIFSGFGRPARIDQVRASVGQARSQTRLVSAQVENQVRTFLDQVQEARLRAEAQQAAVAQARRGYEIASVQFREGLSGRLELTDAEVALRQSEFNLAEAVHDYLTARVLLDQAVGDVPEVNR